MGAGIWFSKEPSCYTESGKNMIQTDDKYVSDRYQPLVDSYNTIAFRLDPAPVLAELRNILLNKYAWDDKIQQWYRPKGIEPKFAEHGVEELMLQLKGRMSVDKVLSKLDINEVNTITRQAVEVVFEFIMMKGDKYGIKESDYSDIVYLIWHNVKIFLNRALGGTENELVSKGFLHREVVTKSASSTDNTQEQGSKGLNIFKGFK